MPSATRLAAARLRRPPRAWLALALWPACGGGAAAPDATPADAARADAPAAADAGWCGVPADSPTGLIEDAIVIADVERSYLLAVPAGYRPDVAHALVFAWHGRGSTAAQARSYFGVEQAAGGAALVVYPQGLPIASLGNDTGWDLAPDGVDVALFDALRARITAAYCVDPARVFSTGHSFGGYLSNELACVRGSEVRAIAAVASGGPFAPCTSGGAAVWLAHGSLDSVVPLAQGLASRDHWQAANGCTATTDPVDPSPCVAYTGCEAGHPLVWCQHDDPAYAGHAWPSFATTAVWAFFADQE